MTGTTNKTAEELEFFSTIAKLKQTARAGWPLHGVPDGESVAEHSFQVATMAMFLAEEVGVNQSRAVMMALIHDIGESVIGDIITERGASSLPNLDKKQTNEREAIKLILGKAGMENYLELFDELVSNITPEAKFVRQLDKLEMAIQAREYERSSGLDLGEFYISAKKHVTNPILLKILNRVITG